MSRSPIEMQPERVALTLPRVVQRGNDADQQPDQRTDRLRHTDDGAGASSGLDYGGGAAEQCSARAGGGSVRSFGGRHDAGRAGIRQQRSAGIAQSVNHRKEGDLKVGPTHFCTHSPKVGSAGQSAALRFAGALQENKKPAFAGFLVTH